MADEDHMAARTMMARHLAVDLGDERADRIEPGQPPPIGLGGDGAGNAVRGHDDDGAIGNLIQLLDEDRPLRLERAHHGEIVDDRPADIDRRAVAGQRGFHRLDRPANPGAEAARRSEQHAKSPPSAVGHRWKNSRSTHRLSPLGHYEGKGWQGEAVTGAVSSTEDI